MAEADRPPGDAQERQWYVHWLLAWNRGPAVEPHVFDQISTFDLARCFVAMQQTRIVSNVEWGAESALAASSEERVSLIDAMVGLDTGARYFGTEPAPTPSAGGFTDEAPIIWAANRRRRLMRLSSKKLAAECQQLLTKHAEAIELHRKTMAEALLTESQHKRELVNLRYDYGASLVEAAQSFRRKRITAKEALRRLVISPFECSNGAIVSISSARDRDRDRVTVKSRDGKHTSITQTQFIKQWWSKGKIKIPPTA